MATLRPSDLLSYAEVAEHLAAHGTTLTVSTLRAYRAGGRFPEPDDATYARVPRWKRSTVDRWLKDRPGQGKGGDPKRHTSTD